MGDSKQTAVYECNCGASMEFREDEFARLRWLANRFGFRNIGDAIGHQRDCCDRPVYASAGHPFQQPYRDLDGDLDE